jgi:hypothetical protein
MRSNSEKAVIAIMLSTLNTINVAAAAELTYHEVVLQEVRISGDGPDFRFIPSDSAEQPVRVDFLTRDGAQPDLASIRVRYGRLGIDITGLLLKYGKIDKHGISIGSNTLPLGTHRASIEVRDTQHRSATMKMRFVVSSVDSASRRSGARAISRQQVSEKDERLSKNIYRLSSENTEPVSRPTIQWPAVVGSVGNPITRIVTTDP